MNDVSILDLFWLILKFLAALGLVGVIAFALYLVWVAIKSTGNIVRGDASVTAIVCFVLAILILGSCVVAAVGYFRDPNFFH
jgi:hypothetical protein